MAGSIWKAACASAALSVAGCGAKTPPPAPPPPPPPAPVARPMPVPPNSAAPNLVIPVADTLGNRLTPNFALQPEQALWNLRIALNVAALNCRDANNQLLISNYSTFLQRNRVAIAASERWVIRDQANKSGSNGISARDSLSTRLYNYFAQPPVLREFCPVAFAISNEAATALPAQILPFASTKIVEIDRPFVNFYNAYATYQVDLASWRAQQPPTSMGLTGQPLGVATPVVVTPTAGVTPVAPAAGGPKG